MDRAKQHKQPTLQELETELGTDTLWTMQRAADEAFIRMAADLHGPDQDTDELRLDREAKLALLLSLLAQRGRCDISRVMKMLDLFERSAAQSFAEGSFSQKRAEA